MFYLFTVVLLDKGADFLKTDGNLQRQTSNTLLFFGLWASLFSFISPVLDSHHFFTVPLNSTLLSHSSSLSLSYTHTHSSTSANTLHRSQGQYTLIHESVDGGWSENQMKIKQTGIKQNNKEAGVNLCFEQSSVMQFCFFGHRCLL